MASPTTGTAPCSYCANAGDREVILADGTRISGRDLVMKQLYIVSGPLITDLNELLRHRDESDDRVIDLTPDAPEHEKLTATRPKMQEVQLDGLTVRLPTGFRPIFRHKCPTIGRDVTLYADVEGGSVQ